MSLVELISYLSYQGYYNFRVIDGQLCGLIRFNFTTGLVHGLDSENYIGRWCFTDKVEAAKVLADLAKLPTKPINLPGEWTKYKGTNENGKYVEVASTSLLLQRENNLM